MEREDIRHVHLFLPIKRLNEINTFPLFKELQKRGYFLYTSLINESEELDVLDISEVSDFEVDSMGIPLPKEQNLADRNKVDLVLIPLLAFDKKGYRLGYGKAYYDRFLKTLDIKVLKVGLSFFAPIESIPHEAHDVAMDYCITPEKIFKF